MKICLCRKGSIRLTIIWTLCVNWEGAHIRYSVNLVLCANFRVSGAIPPMLSNCTSPQIDTVKGVTISIVTSPVYHRANVNARFKNEIWVMCRKVPRVVAAIWQFRIQGAPDQENVAWPLHGGPCNCQKVISVHSVHSAWDPRMAVLNHDLAGQEKGSRVLWTNSMVVTVSGGRKIVEKSVNRAPEWCLFSNRRKLACCATRSGCAGRCASHGIMKSR